MSKPKQTIIHIPKHNVVIHIPKHKHTVIHIPKPKHTIMQTSDLSSDWVGKVLKSALLCRNGALLFAKWESVFIAM